MSDTPAIDTGPRRLSKPRTNTSSSNLLSLSEQSMDLASPLNSSASDYFGENAVVVNSQGERRSRRKSRSKIRAYLYGSNHEAIQTSSEDEDGRGTFNGAARDMRKRLSRTGSSIMQIQSAKASTARLSKSESQGSDVEESAIVADQIKERAYYDSLAAQNHISSPVDEHKHPDSVMAPLRRKSLYTPGLATRNPIDILRKPPQQDSLEPRVDLDYYYDPSKPATSPLSQIAALRAGEDGRSTPSNLQYSQLGGLQLGTLRVTNGSPVPGDRGPDHERSSPTLECRSHDGFYTASEGSVAGELSTPVPRRGRSPLRFENKHEPSIESGLEDSGTSRGWSSSIHQTNGGATTIAHEYMAELDGGPFSDLETPSLKEIPDEGNSLDDEGIVIPHVEGLAADVWRRFIDDAETRHGATVTREDAFHRLNGTTLSVPESQRLSVPSSMASRYSVPTEVPKTDSGYSSNSSLTASHATLNTVNKPETQPKSTPEDFLRRSRCLSGPREMPHRTSMPGGYLSQPADPAPYDYSFNIISQNTLPSPAPSLAAISSSQTVSPVRPSARASSSNIIRKLQKPRPKSQPPPIDCVAVQRKHSLSRVDIPRVPSLIAIQHAERLRHFPLLEHTFPSSHHTTYDESVSPTEPEPKPMPIRFPSPENASEAATSSPFNMVSRLQEKRKSRSRAPSQHRAGNTVHVDESIASAIVRSPSWSDFGGRRKSKEQKRQTREDRGAEKHLAEAEKELEKHLQREKKAFEKQTRRDEEVQRSSRSRSVSRTRAKSSERRSNQYHTPTTIADFGTVTESLGGNPYDIATSMFPSASQSACNWHPHQISTAMPRPKSVAGTDEAAAAESARARSRARSESVGRQSVPVNEGSVDCQSFIGSSIRPQAVTIDVPPVPALAAVDLRARGLEWAHSRRSQSFSGANFDSSFNDRGGLPGRSIRPASLLTEAPPVPALPSIHQAKQLQAQTTVSRPQSIVADSSPIPSVPSSQIADQEDCLVSISPSPSKGAMARPRKTRTSKPVPDLWSNGSIEKKAPKAIEQLKDNAPSSDASSSDEVPSERSDSVWEAQRLAWSQRRKSAGEALLRNQITEIFDGRNHKASTITENKDRPLSMTGACVSERQDTARSEQTSKPTPTPMTSFPNPLGSNPTSECFHSAPRPLIASSKSASYHPVNPRETPRPGPSPLAQTPLSQKEPQIPTPAQRLAQTQSFSIPRKRVGSGTSTPNAAFERLAGRYTGGLQYGYEPGCGLGGSAGFRGAQTEASRKSVEVSKGFGLDLSDVPIFVAPSLAR